MAEILKLRGSPALSPFRLEKIRARLAQVAPGARIAGAEFWHFVETARALDERERAVLDQLLTYGDPVEPASDAGVETGVISVAPADTLNFGAVPYGEEQMLPVTVTNKGRVALHRHVRQTFRDQTFVHQ